MKTLIGKEESLLYAEELLKQGELVAFPTETVYGLGADAFNVTAVKQIFVAKGRPQDNPLIVHIGDIEDLPKVAKNIPPLAYILFKAFSPGPLTVVLEKAEKIPYETTAGLETVGIRIPSHPLTLKLLNSSKIPLAGPSANSSGKVSPTTAEFVYEDMNGKIPLILDGGECEVGVESTIIDLTKEVPKILRPGAVTPTMFLKYTDKIETSDGKIVGRAICPGMKYTHYKPICECKFCGNLESVYNYQRLFPNKKIVVVGRNDFISGLKGIDGYGLGDTYGECMKNVYYGLRKLEKNYDIILLQKFPLAEETTALMNRMEKSTGGEEI